VAKTTECTPISLKADRGSKPRGRERCKAQTKAGGVCLAPAVERGFCFFHANPEKLAELGRQGGRKNRRWKPDACDLPMIPLKSVEDLIGLLEETINRVRQGPFDLRAANTIGFLAGIHLKALDQRVEAPETNSEASSGIYTSLFQRLALPVAPEADVFELFPQPQQEDTNDCVVPCALPAPGESIDETPPPPDNNPRVITIEVG
jgi:hypothetical protein